jgi:hypothetical protein
VGVEADRVDVEEGDQRGAGVCRQLCEELGPDRRNSYDESVGLQNVWLRQPRLNGLAIVSARANRFVSRHEPR